MPADPLPDGEVFDARKSGPQCNQLGVGEEDCLLLNVYSRMVRQFSLFHFPETLNIGTLITMKND